MKVCQNCGQEEEKHRGADHLGRRWCPNGVLPNNFRGWLGTWFVRVGR